MVQVSSVTISNIRISPFPAIIPSRYLIHLLRVDTVAMMRQYKRLAPYEWNEFLLVAEYSYAWLIVEVGDHDLIHEQRGVFIVITLHVDNVIVVVLFKVSNYKPPH